MRSKDRFRVHDFYNTNRLELFNMWLDYDKSWDAVTLAVERVHQTKQKSTTGMIAVKGKNLRKEYSDEQVEKLIKSRKESGLWYADTDFPDCEEDT